MKNTQKLTKSQIREKTEEIIWRNISIEERKAIVDVSPVSPGLNKLAKKIAKKSKNKDDREMAERLVEAEIFNKQQATENQERLRVMYRKQSINLYNAIRDGEIPMKGHTPWIRKWEKQENIKKSIVK